MNWLPPRPTRTVVVTDAATPRQRHHRLLVFTESKPRRSIRHRNRFTRTNNSCLANQALPDPQLDVVVRRVVGLGANTTCANLGDRRVDGAHRDLAFARQPLSFFFKAVRRTAQDRNKDRAYLSTTYRDNVDYPTGWALLQRLLLAAHGRRTSTTARGDRADCG